MERLRNLMSLSIIGGNIVRPVNSEVIATMTELTFLDRIPRNIPDERKFGVCRMYDETIVFDLSGDEVSNSPVPKAIIDSVSSLRDGIMLFGYMHGSQFCLVDAYQEAMYDGRQGSGWLSPTFAPAYFGWVIWSETMLRYAVLKNGLANIPKRTILRKYCGASGYVIVRSSVKDIYQGDDRLVYYIDALEGYE